MNEKNLRTIADFKKKLPELGKRIRLARMNMGMTQEELANEIGISSKSISALEVGRVEASISQIQAIAVVLEEPVSYFTGDATSMVASRISRVAIELEQIRKMMQSAGSKK